MPPILVPSFAKRITRHVLVISKLNEREDFILRGFVSDIIRLYRKQNEQLTHKKRFESCSRLRMRTLERYQWRLSSVYIVNCKRISNILVIIGIEKQTFSEFIMKR